MAKNHIHCKTCMDTRRVVYWLRSGKIIGPAKQNVGSLTKHRKVMACPDCTATAKR